MDEREVLRSHVPTQEMIEERDKKYLFNKAWRELACPSAVELKSSFTITSGELIWGQSKSVVAGMKSAERDVLFSEPKASIEGGTIYQAPWNYRVAAKPGEWKVARVHRNFGKFGGDVQTGWIAYHASADPAHLLSLSKDIWYGNRTAHPRVTFVNRYDWGYHGQDDGDTERTIADIDPEEWSAAWSTKNSLWLDGLVIGERHQDYAKWERLEPFQYLNAFFIDAEKGPNVVKLLARPSNLDERVDKKQSSSLFSEGEPNSFGCHLRLPEGDGYEVARLIYGETKSDKFPEDDELLGFWYDSLHSKDGMASDPSIDPI